MLPKTETLEDFYQHKFNYLPEDIQKDIGHFNVFRVEDCVARPVSYSRRDYYKIALIRGHNRYHYADKSVEVDGCTLMFFNPLVPYTWEPLSTGERTGFFCIFSKSFFTDKIGSSISDLPMYQPGGKPAYVLNLHEEEQVCNIFNKMLDEIKSDYAFIFSYMSNHKTKYGTSQIR